MLDSDNSENTNETPAAEAGETQPKAAPRKRAAKKAAPAADGGDGTSTPAPRKRAAKKAAPAAETDAPAEATSGGDAAPAKKATKKAAKKPAKKAAATKGATESGAAPEPVMSAPSVLFVAPESAPAAASSSPAPAKKAAAKKSPAKKAAKANQPNANQSKAGQANVAATAEDETVDPEEVREAAAEEATGAARKRRRRGRRGRGSGGGGGNRPADGTDADSDEDDESAEDTTDEQTEEGADGETSEGGTSSSAARRRRRRRSGSGGGGGAEAGDDDPPNTVTHVREPRETDDGVKGVKGSTRLAARSQRRRDGRDTNRRRPSILTEAEFLARRESVERVMAVRQNGDRTQIAVLEDDVLVEHYVTRASATSYVGNVYLGRVQNVLPSMEAAFVDIGKGRNGVLYAGEVNWDAAGLEGKSRAIENALKSGDTVLVQVTKDPIGHKGARLTSQISLPGRFLVYVPGGGMTGISRRLPDTERHRLKSILKKIVPEEAGVIVRTAAEGASDDDLTRDVERLTAQWAAIEKKAKQTKSAPLLVHGEPDLATRVVRDVFNEDFKSLVVQGEDAWRTVSEYVESVAPDLAGRVSKHATDSDLFHDLRVDEQLMKALDRKVWLPSGGSLVIDRTEAMTVIDVNTGKFVGAGGNLEQTVTRNNLEAAEEIVRQLRLRDVGGIVVIDFIDMVLESNRELVLRRLTECLGRDRTKHQVAEVTSLGLVQMTRKRVGEGLLEAFSETCPTCNGRGVLVHGEPVDKTPAGSDEDDRPHGKSSRRKRGGRNGGDAAEPEVPAIDPEQRKAASAAIQAIHRAAHGEAGGPDGLVDELADGLVAAARDEVAAEQADEPDVTEPESAEAAEPETAAVEAEATAEAEPEATTPAEPNAAAASEPAAVVPDGSPDGKIGRAHV